LPLFSTLALYSPPTPREKCRLTTTAALAGPIDLTFEGLQNSEAILNYYAGGFGGSGSGPGPNYGITFGPDSLALISTNVGGGGNFSNNPSGTTIAYFVSGPGDLMNVAGGFTTGFSFFYSAAGSGSVDVYSGPDGTGTLLASLNLTQNYTDVPCNGAGPFCGWDPIGVTFSGTAQSVLFSGTANEVGFDDITLGSSTPGNVTPEPSSLLLLGTGLVTGYCKLRRRFAK
jgi:hypothetical protein